MNYVFSFPAFSSDCSSEIVVPLVLTFSNGFHLNFKSTWRCAASILETAVEFTSEYYSVVAEICQKCLLLHDYQPVIKFKQTSTLCHSYNLLIMMHSQLFPITFFCLFLNSWPFLYNKLTCYALQLVASLVVMFCFELCMYMSTDSINVKTRMICYGLLLFV